MSRRRRWLAAALLGLLGLGLAAGWLLGTAAGLRFVLARAAAAMPELALEAEQVEGRLGAMQLGGVSVQLAGRALRIERLQLVWQPLALLVGRLSVQQLQGESLQLGAAPSAPAPADPFDPDDFDWGYPIPALPLSLAFEQVRLLDARIEDQPLFDRLELVGEIGADGRLQLQQLRLQRGDDRIDAQGRLPAAPGARGLRGSWRMAGLEGQLALAADRDGGALVLNADEGRAELAASLQAPRSWQLRLGAKAARLAPLQPHWPEPLNLQLRLQGEGSRASLSGLIEQQALQLEALNAELRWEAAASTLHLGALEARHARSGTLRLDGALRLQQSIGLLLQADLERWPLVLDRAAEPVPRFAGNLRAEGELDALEIVLAGALSRGDQQLPLVLEALLGAETLQLQRVELNGAAGTLRGEGLLQFEPRLALELTISGSELDPGWLDPQLSSALSLQARLRASEQDDGWNAELDLSSLQGRWREAPLSASGRLAWRDEALRGTLDAELGDGRLQLSGEGQQARLSMQTLPLDLLWPGLSGQLGGELAVDGLPDAPSWDADLQARGLGRDALKVSQLSLRGGLDRQGSRSLLLDWEGAELLPQIRAQSGSLRLDGNLADYRAALQTAGEGLQLEAGWQGALTDAQALRLEGLVLRSQDFGDWQLSQPARIAWRPVLEVEPTCLQSSDASLCLQGIEVEEARGLLLELQALPLQQLATLAGADESLAVSGSLSSRLRLRVSPEFALVDGEGELAGGDIIDRALERPVALLAWQDARWTLRQQAGRLALDASAVLAPQGQLSAQLEVDASAPADTTRWDGDLRLDIEQLQALALLAPDLTAARGALRGELRWRPGQPAAGQITLEGFEARIAALGIALRDSSISLRQGETGLLLDGLLHSGEGPLRIEGELQSGRDPRARLRIAGDGVLVSDTPQLALRASPDLQVGWRNGLLSLRGQVGIPRALIDLERLESGVQASPDVVVMDPREGPRGAAALPLDADIRVRLGDDVRLSGFGFDGRISGQLALREEPGRAMLGRGTLDLGGTYRAYGQELDIERGRLLFASSPLDNPGIDLRARRPLREVEVGVEVRGPARRPQLSLWSRPAMDQAEALSWLVLGQPLASATEADGAQLGQAAAAIGGNLLAARVGGRLGFDTFGVADSEALGGAAFTVGKYLSPKLYLSYGVGLFEEGRVVTLRYLISRHFDIELESARESRAGVNYRIETD